MNNIRKLRVEAFNNWPVEVKFPELDKYLKLLAKENIQVPMRHCELAFIEDKDFHFYVAYLLDGLDSLPSRPDRAFESFYIPLEIEMKRLKILTGNHSASRFSEYKNFLSNQPPPVIASLVKFIELAPLQICEFAANRILNAKIGSDHTDTQLIKRGKDALGADFFEAFCNKYSLATNSQVYDEKAKNQRKAGGLIRLVLRGEEVIIDGVKFEGNSIDRIGILSTFILPSIRNDRFHGNVFPSFRSSKYKLKNFAGSQFACTTSFLLVLLSIYSRWPTSVTPEIIQKTIDDNVFVFNKVFFSELRK